MPYTLHLVPRKRSTEVVVSLLGHGSIGPPMNQRTFPNWVKLLGKLGPYLKEEERARAKARLMAGQAYVVMELWLSDDDIDVMGL